METTRIYVELLIIGVESSVWLFFLSSYFISSEKVMEFISHFDSTPFAVIFIGILYIIGLIFDRFSDTLLKCLERKIRSDSKLEADAVLNLPLDEKQHIFLVYTRSRIRLLRSTVVNTLFIFISLMFFLNKLNVKFSVIVTAVFIGLFIFALSIYSLINTLKTFYCTSRKIEIKINTVTMERTDK